MPINFNVGDFVLPNTPYLEKTLPSSLSASISKQTLASLGNILGISSEVTATGSVGSPAKSFIRVVPTKTTNIAYKKGQGIIIYFDNDTQLNNSLELSTAYLLDKCFI